MHQWQFCGQRLHPQRYCHWNTGCKYMTEGPVVNHSFILPTISHHWNTGCQKSRCWPHLYLTYHIVTRILDRRSKCQPHLYFTYRISSREYWMLISTQQKVQMSTTSLSCLPYHHWSIGCKYMMVMLVMNHASVSCQQHYP